MENKWLFLFIGIFIGWITKTPFLIKWYRELKQTHEYKLLELRKNIYRYNLKNPDKKIEI